MGRTGLKLNNPGVYDMGPFAMVQEALDYIESGGPDEPRAAVRLAPCPGPPRKRPIPAQGLRPASVI